MLKYILPLIALLSLNTSRARAQDATNLPGVYQHSASSTKSRPQAEQKYTCLMHPEVIADRPGQCPKCGMTLVPMKEREHPTSNTEHRTPMSEGHQSHSSDMSHPGAATPDQHHMADHSMTADGMQMAMQSSINIADPMNRESSGTAWVPDSTPIYGYMKMFGDDMLMLHGGIFPRYTNVSSDRGDDRIDAPNWIMAMYSHPFSESAQLSGRLMMSLDPLTEGGRGYPLLFQSGESWHDQPLHDRQHPHDLFDELSLSYSQKLDHDFSLYFYFGYPGEPALGPPTFMHRLSAMDNPDAPIGHHWQDSSHITFGVATGGLQWRNIKVEASCFTGREPDENRYDFDRPRFDSFSGRLSWNPTPNLALQVSHGYLKSPEALEPKINEHRTTASIIYNLPLGHDRNWSNTFVWGQDDKTFEGKTQSFLLETDYQWERNTLYGRWELVEKSGDELVLKPRDAHLISTVNAISIGYIRDLTHGGGLDIGLGGQVTLDIWPNELDPYYGDGPGYGFQVFLRIRPSRHGHDMAMESTAPAMK